MAKDKLKRNAREADKIAKQSKSRSAKRIRKLTKMKERLASQKEHNAKGANRVWLRDMKDPLVRRDASIANESARIADHGGSQKDRKRFEQKALKTELKEKYKGKPKSKMARYKSAMGRVNRMSAKIGPSMRKKYGGKASITPKLTGLELVGAAIAEVGARKVYPAVKKRIKRNQDTAHRRRVERQDKRLMKKYKKKDPKRQAVFKKLMSKKTKIKEY